MDKIKLLFFNLDKGGVNYFRTETPAIQLKKSSSDIFDVTVVNELKFETYDTAVEFFKEFEIIHYHRTIFNNLVDNLRLINELKTHGIKLIVDIDDYWELDKTHPLYMISLKNNLKDISLQNIINADVVTTTTDFFADEIKKYNKNTFVLYNGVNSEILPQFKSNNNFDRDILNISYIGGSSHFYDVKLLDGVVNILNSDNATRGKFRVILGGFDTNGSISERQINEEFVKILKMLKLYNNKILNTIKINKGNISNIKEIPQQIRDLFKDKVFINKKRDIKPQESTYFKYENILTDNYKLINNNREYMNYLNKFTSEKYINEDSVQYIRRWTAKPNQYAYTLDETDILIAPLVNNKFNNFKSNLKQVEASTRKLPIICSDVIPYNIDGINNVNSILIKPSKNEFRDWGKAIKKLILNKNLRIELGNNLYNDFNEKYNLENINKNRVELYKSLVAEYA
jgi:glycosyltransferase involved in cell wall biosynthesis